MSSRRKRRQILLAALPVAYFAFLAVQQARADWQALVAPRFALDTTLSVAALGYLALIMLTYWRKPEASAERRDWRALLSTFIAIDALGITMLLPVTQPEAWAPSATLSILGTILAAWAVISLGKSFSLLPQARRLVTSGPYAVVRHPIYAGGFLITLAELWLRWSPLAIALTFVFVTAQLVRLHIEEQLLADTFDDYPSYRASTSALIPGVY